MTHRDELITKSYILTHLIQIKIFSPKNEVKQKISLKLENRIS